MNVVIRSARALGWLRWRMFVNAFKGTRRRDTLERLSRAGSVIVPIILGAMFVPAFLASCAFSIIGGWAVGQKIQATPAILVAVRLALGAVTGVILFVPAIRAARGSSSNLVRLTLLPVPRRVLHAADLLSGLTDPWIALLVPVMTLFPIGLVLSGEVLGGLIALLAGIALLIAFLALESSVSSILALLYRDRLRGEIVTLVVLLTLSLSGFVPLMFSRHFDDTGRHQRGRSRRGEVHRSGGELAPPPLPGAPGPSGSTGSSGGMPDTPGAPPSAGPVATPESGGSESAEGAASPAAAPKAQREKGVTFPAVFSFLPSELYVRALYEPVRARTGIGLLGLLGLAGIAGALYAISYATYRRLLDSPENISARRGARAEPSAWRLPGLGSAASAVAQAQFRLVLRTVHGKMAIFFTPVSLLIVGFMLRSYGHGGSFLGSGGGSFSLGPLYAYAGATFALLAPQRFLLNVFATDGAGLTLALLSPISDRELVLGKSTGMAILSAIPMLIITTIVMVISPPAPIALWATVYVAAVSSYLVLAPAGALISAVFPKAVNMNRLTGASNPNGIASLIGIGLTAAACGPPGLVAAVTYLASGSPILVLLAVLGYAAVAAVVALLLTHAAAQVVAARRENLALVAQGR